MEKEVVQIRIAKDLKNEAKERAEKLNMTLSGYLIFLMQKDLKKI